MKICIIEYLRNYMTSHLFMHSPPLIEVKKYGVIYIYIYTIDMVYQYTIDHTYDGIHMSFK